MQQALDMISSEKPARISFGPFCLMPSARLLTRNGVPVDIGGRSFDLLVALVEQPGRVLSKRELLNRVWSDVVVDDGSLRFHMVGLRKILGDGENGERYIATQVGVGYAFVAPLSVSVSSPEDAATEIRPAASDPSITSRRLPPRPSRLVGRSDDILWLSERIVHTQHFTIVGPAGVGKTTLAVEMAYAALDAFGGNAAFVDLSLLEDPALVASAIATSLGIPVQVEDPMMVVLRHIRDERLLLVIDNCEHVIDAISSIVERISAGAPAVHVLATSREPLRTSREHVHWLGPLAYPSDTDAVGLDELLAYPAIELFIERARAGGSALVVDVEAAELIADMCRRLDGMALPIELAAVRVASHGLMATARLLDERFSLGWMGRRTAGPRHQTLQAALDWSYELLSKSEKMALERLSVFIGPFDIEAAISVIADETLSATLVAAALDELANKSLVSANHSSNSGSYRLLEMTRAYAREKLKQQEPDLVREIHRRHAAYYLHLLEASDQPISEIVAKGTGRLGNIRGALEWSFGLDGDREIAGPLAAEAAEAFLHLSLLVECRTWCARAITDLDASFRATQTELELQAALGLALMFTRGNSEAAEVALRRALTLAIELDDRCSQLRILGRLHIFHERIGDFATAKSWAEMAVEVAAVINESEAIAVAASLAGISLHLAGRQIDARREFEKALRHSLPSDRARTIHYGFDHRNRSRIGLARTLWLLGCPDQAKAHAEEAVTQALRLDHAPTYCIALIWALSVYSWRGDLRQATATLEAFAKCSEINAFGPYMAATPGLREALAISSGQSTEGFAAIEESLARVHAARYELMTTSLEMVLAEGLATNSRLVEALELLDNAIRRCNSNGELIAMPELLRLRAFVLSRTAFADIQASEALLRQSIDTSKEQGAYAWELRAATDLAELLGASGRAGEGAALLAPLRHQIAEGADTADVRLADAVLKRLGSTE
jgi:predicted ATPase/DNA-binding winged helix-turn-helix (wHTH) protein